MPLMHSEELTIHDQALPLFKTYTNEMIIAIMLSVIVISLKNLDGYPHRNAILGRLSSAEEVAFWNSQAPLLTLNLAPNFLSFWKTVSADNVFKSSTLT